MDREQLKISLLPFQETCRTKGRPVSDICVDDAFPGDSSTSFIVRVKAQWVDEVDCSNALDFLFETLFETIDENIRKYIFSIDVLDSTDELHCQSTSNENRLTENEHHL